VTTILVTGAAGGIGQATVEAFLEVGFEVIGLDREMTGSRQGYTSRIVELTDMEMVRAALTDVGPLQHVVSVAGRALALEKNLGDFAELPLETFRDSIEQNLVTAFITLRAAIPHLRAAEGDRSVSFTTSTDALISYGLPGYAAAKAGIIGLVHSLTSQLGREGIRINAVAPGDIPTPRNQREWAHIPNWYEDLARASALGRLGTPDEIAQTFVALATKLTNVTGQTLVVDSGFTISGPGSRNRYTH